MNKKLKMGFVPANRGFFSTELARQMRGETLAAMEKLGIVAVVPDDSITKAGCVGTLEEAEVCGKLFRREEVDGILIGAVNFGDEQSAVTAVKLAGLNVPVMIFGCQEQSTLRPDLERRDAFCGLLSIGEALRQIGTAYTVGQTPICFPRDESFRADLEHFARVCRVVTGIRGARYGQVGARPNDFWTCRFDEKMLQALGVTTVTMDLSEAIGAVGRMADDEPGVREIVESFKATMDTSAVVPSSLLRIAKFEKVLGDFVSQAKLDALAIQCWTSLQANLGVCACATMGRFDDRGIPCACESDVLGAMSMHALQLASGSAAALADWNNLHNDDPELANLWHCGVFPASFAKTAPKMGVQEIISATTGRENAMGVVEFVMKEGPLTLCRVTQGAEGWKVFIGQGQIEDNPATTFGAYGWCRIPGLQQIYRRILLRHFPHHVGITRAHVGNALYEAFGNYFGMAVYHGEQAVPGVYDPELPF